MVLHLKDNKNPQKYKHSKSIIFTEKSVRFTEKCVQIKKNVKCLCDFKTLPF